METKKVLGIIFSLLFVIAFAFVLTWGIINFNTVKDGMSGTGVYTKQDVDNAYNDGYNTALIDKAEYTSLISSYRDTITTLNDEISQFNSQVNNLQKNNKDYSNQVESLTTQKNTLQEQVTNLANIKETNETTIANLNLRIANLNNQINDILLQSQDTTSQITALNNKINELQKSINYYESYIASLENEQQVVATFEFNGSVYNIQVVNKNSIISVVNPTATDYVIFNYWTVNNEKIDLTTYQITTNTKIVANVTYKYDVTFVVDGTTIDSQIVTQNGYATLPATPTKDGYEFVGWTLNGTDVVEPTTILITEKTTYFAKFNELKYNVSFVVDGTTVDSQIVTQNGYATLPTTPTKDGYEFDGWTLNGTDIVEPTTMAITEKTTFTAKFTKLHTVTFIYEDTTYTTQTIRNNEFCSSVSVENTNYKVFNGWTLNGVIVDITAQKIVADTTFIADITYKHDVTFVVDGTTIDSQIVTQNGYATLPAIPTKDGYEFVGWTLNGTDVVEPTTIAITHNTTFTAKFSECSYIFESNFRTLLKEMNSNISNATISSMSFLSTSEKSKYLGTLPSGIKVYYSIDSNNKYELDFVAPIIYAPISCEYMFTNFYQCTSLNFDNFDTSNVTNMSRMFSECYALTSDLNLDSFNTSNVTNMSRMFDNCSKLTSLNIDNFDTSNVTDMSYMFCDCRLLKSLDVSSFDTSKVINMKYMFSGCYSLQILNLNNFNTSKVTNMGGMFFDCKKLFSINLSSFDTSKVTNMGGMFHGCLKLESLDVSNFDVSNVTSMASMFSSCSSIINLDLSNFDTVNVTSMFSMFEECLKLTTLNISNFNTQNVTSYDYMFDNCTDLHKANIVVGENYTLNNLPD